MRSRVIFSQPWCFVAVVILILLNSWSTIALAEAESTSLRRFAVVCGSSVLEGLLGLTTHRDKTWKACRERNVPIECESSCGGSRLTSRSRERACWLCQRWRTIFYGEETPWLWSPLSISACERLGYGSSQDFVDTFTSTNELFQLARRSTIPDLLSRTNYAEDKSSGGGGGAGLEMWCNGERFLWFGGGGGGGISKNSTGRGGGAGLQTSFGWALGAGGGGGIETLRDAQSQGVLKQSISFGFEQDTHTPGMRQGTSEDVDSLKRYIKECFEKQTLQIFGGGGSGGDTLSAAVAFNMTSCDYRLE